MKKIAITAFAALSALTLAACGHSDDVTDKATPDNVEVPADELPANEPSLAAPPPVAPAVDASQAALSAEDAARNNAANALSVAEAARAEAAKAAGDTPPPSQ